MKNISPIQTIAWKELKKHFSFIKTKKIVDLFNEDPERFSSFSEIFENQILIDFSKNQITKETITKLIALAEECELKSSILSMFNGEKVNYTENKPVLHTALRNRDNCLIKVNKKYIMPQIKFVLSKMKRFCNSVISGSWKGYTGKKITDIVNIGIGGSYLGPYMVTESLKAYRNHLNIHFISNVDGTNFLEIIKNISADTTLFLISSKTFTTQETLTNANSAKNWFLKFAKKEKNMIYHFFALSANIKEAKKFGIDENNIFEFWDWVGGRFSLWSSAGLSIALSIGFSNFEKMLDGAYSMDKHFLHTPLKKNLPVLLALISIWYNNFFGTETEAILPYDQYMHKFPSYLQQANMESNGKSVDKNGNPVQYQTGSIIWGDVGTNGQHSFYQLIHQGTKIIPCDFIIPIISHNAICDHHDKLLSNFFAQTKALAFGKNRKLIEKEIQNFENKSEIIKQTIPFKVCDGNRPTNSILIRKITPYNLGALVALYEHKIFTQGEILNIYTFDQWGVELGKQLAEEILPELIKNKKTVSYDSSTNGLINFYKRWKYNTFNKNF